MTRIFLLLILSAISLNLRADADYTGSMTLSGRLGESINFSLYLDYYGNGPVLLCGETVYRRANGKTSSIKVYGEWDIDTSGSVRLYEFSSNKICGNFYFKLEGPLDAEQQVPVTGYWKFGEKSFPFVDVIASAITDSPTSALNEFPSECKFLKPGTRSYLHHADWDWREASGTYGYEYPADEVVESFQNHRSVSLVMSPDSVRWEYQDVLHGKPFTYSFNGRQGYGNKKGVHQNSWAFSIGNADYDVINMEDVLLIYRTNPEAVPDRTLPRSARIEGVYPRLTIGHSYYAEKQIRQNSPTAKTHCSFSLSVPYTDDPLLADSIRGWVLSHMSIDRTNKDSYFGLCRDYAVRATTLSDEEASIYEEDWQIPYYEYHIYSSDLGAAKYLNLTLDSYDFLGGAHGFPGTYTQTISRATGRGMTWKRWFTHPDLVRPLVDKAIREQNDEVSFFEENAVLELPAHDPYYSDGFMHFHYQSYEIAPYSEGQPSCDIPVKDLLPFMTAEAQRLVK